MLSHEQVTQAMKDAHARMTGCKEKLEHLQAEMLGTQKLYVAAQGQYALCADLLQKSAMAEGQESTVLCDEKK